MKPLYKSSCHDNYAHICETEVGSIVVRYNYIICTVEFAPQIWDLVHLHGIIDIFITLMLICAHGNSSTTMLYSCLCLIIKQ